MRESGLLVMLLAVIIHPGNGLAQQGSDTELPPSVSAELAPNYESGPRLIQDLSDEAQKIRRQQLMRQSNRVMPPVPRAQKKALFDMMTPMSSMSMRDLFNFMTDKIKADPELTFDDVVEAMELKANEVNFKKVGHNEFWRDVSAFSGLPTLRLEILQFCDASVGRRMLDYSPEFSIFIPCRITVMEDATGEIWLMTLDWDVSWLARAWQPGSRLDPELVKDAIRIRDAMTEIMQAGASGDW
ncbi:MAG: DUF302 domain-containing protein [Gammaproteobacteria bacterium]|nr:DUF302 domain-containing protein [Gammaproteobacteria bacterium]